MARLSAWSRESPASKWHGRRDFRFFMERMEPWKVIMETVKWKVCRWFYFSSWGHPQVRDILFLEGFGNSRVFPFFNRRCLRFANQTLGVYLNREVEGGRGPWWKVAWRGCFSKSWHLNVPRGLFKIRRIWHYLNGMGANRMPKMDIFLIGGKIVYPIK